MNELLTKRGKEVIEECPEDSPYLFTSYRKGVALKTSKTDLIRP